MMRLPMALLEEFEKLGQFAFLEFAFQVGRSGFAGQAEGEVGADDGPGGGGGGVFVPGIAVTGGENGGENVGTAEGGERRAVEDGEEKESEGTQVAEGGGEGLRDSSARGRCEQRQHVWNISHVVDLRVSKEHFPRKKERVLSQR